MALSRFARSLALQRRPVHYTEQPFVDKTRRVQGAREEVRPGTPEFDRVMAEFRKASATSSLPGANGSRTIADLQQMMRNSRGTPDVGYVRGGGMSRTPAPAQPPKAAASEDPALKRLREGFYDTPDATYQRQQVLMGGLDPRGGSNYRDAIYKAAIREEQYREAGPAVDKYYNPLRQRAQFSISRKRGGFGVLTGGK